MWEKLVRAFCGAKPGAAAPRRELAIAVLLLEALHADAVDSPEERVAVRSILRDLGELDARALDALLQEAEEEVRRAVSLHSFIARLNQELGPADKGELIGGLWRVAHADGHVHPQEELLIRRIADLLYVPHHEFIRQKLATGPA
ncbi:TerB family tellurite resistance protein [Solimonas sp. K1W22B-7]|uniref:tellurite resistance TerB family protein n=1 Tax=Solimonas sp. K1W22B-7 TaxID=2303331 RepID=UPI0013C4E39C|nr:TerB family tellurite resistance protein [Solimonas sp. K1W22B-7]